MCFNNGNNDCSCLWIILIIILLVKPAGLLGKQVQEKV